MSKKSDRHRKSPAQPKKKKTATKSGASASTTTRSRTAKSGDISPSLTKAGIEQYSVAQSTAAARESKTAAVKDILERSARSGSKALLETLDAILRGASPDDIIAMNNLLAKHVAAAKTAKRERSDFELADDWRDGGYPYKNLMSRRNYEREKYKLQVELLKLQAWVRSSGQRLVILFEGRDAAGKGGAIKRFMEHLNPRGARVVALEKPSETERGQWYFQRYVEHLPTKGEIVLFDRSWYNRAGVEKVMGFCTDEEYLEYMRQAPEFER
ncbi:MAG: polyphosphate kinase 2, partial [Verrucomicrobiae bacterium]|nr:polyphosphate kinase 2 [Verrucomicrobiae bacterium]